MVQEKDAAKKRRQSLNDFLDAEAERYRKSVVKTEWAIVEHTPGYNTGGYYDQDVPAENRVVSPWFDTEKEASEWRDRHEPDKGNYLLLAHRDLTRKVVENWNGPFIERTPR